MATTIAHSPVGIIVTSMNQPLLAGGKRPLLAGGKRPLHASRVCTRVSVVILAGRLGPVGWHVAGGVHHGPFGSMIVCGDGEQHGQYGAGPGRAVHGTKARPDRALVPPMTSVRPGQITS